MGERRKPNIVPGKINKPKKKKKKKKFCNVAYKHGTYMIKYKPNKLCLLFFNHDNIMNIVYAKSTILKVISNIRPNKKNKTCGSGHMDREN